MYEKQTENTLLARVAQLPGYQLRDGVLYYQGGKCQMDDETLKRILAANDRPYDAMG